MGIESSRQIKHLSANSTATGYTVTPGRVATKPANMVSLSGPDGKRARGFEATLFGAGSATQTFAAKFYGVKSVVVKPDQSAIEYDVYLLFEVATCTLGTMPGAGVTGGILTTDLVCDTLSNPVVDAYLTKSIAAYGGVAPSVHSPTGNGEARLFCPDAGNAEWVLPDYDMTGATSGNCLIERVT